MGKSNLFFYNVPLNKFGITKPLCILLMFAGLRIGEACALKWKDVNFENKTLKVERGITQVAKFDEKGKVIGRVTVVADTKTACSARNPNHRYCGGNLKNMA